jgi:hypothetical protein
VEGQAVPGAIPTEKEARLWEHEAAKALRAGKPLPGAKASGGGAYDTIQGLLDVVIKTDWAHKAGSRNSIDQARKFVAYVGPEIAPRDALTIANVDEFISSMMDENRIGGSTVNRYLSAISKLSKKGLRGRPD